MVGLRRPGLSDAHIVGAQRRCARTRRRPTTGKKCSGRTILIGLK